MPDCKRLREFLKPFASEVSPPRVAGLAGSVEEIDALGLTTEEIVSGRASGYPFNPMSEAIAQKRADLVEWLGFRAPELFDRGFEDPVAEDKPYTTAFAGKPSWEVFDVLRALLPEARLRADFFKFPKHCRGDDFDPNAPVHKMALLGKYSGGASDAIAVACWLGPNAAILPSLEGMTPLMLAAQAQWAEMTEALLDMGADPSWENRLGQSAIGLARDWSRGDPAMFALFEREGLKAFLSAKTTPVGSAPKRRL